MHPVLIFYLHFVVLDYTITLFCCSLSNLASGMASNQQGGATGGGGDMFASLM